MDLEKKDILFLVGIKHSGKTTYAKRIADRFGWIFADLDELIIPQLKGKTIRDFYLIYGKNAFMDKEREVLKSFLENLEEPTVISLGGGVSDNKGLLELIKDTGMTIYLKREEKEMLPKVIKDGIPPFLDPSNLETSFHEVYKVRDNIYRTIADVTIDLGEYRDKDETEEFLLDVLKGHGYGF